MPAHLPYDPPVQISRTRFVGCVFLPYAAAYFLSYLFRTINAVIGAELAAEFHLSATDLGLLTAVYFFAFAVAQIPLGVLLDRLDSGLVQSALMLFASVGALIFAGANCFSALVIGRGLIGLGLAATLIAGLKTIVVWVSSERISLVTGIMVMSGALGALAATGPADIITQCLGWRGLFVVLAALTALTALAVLLTTPETTVCEKTQQPVLNISAVYRDQRFRRIAPLCALGIGSSWSLQSLWAAPWMRDVQGFDQMTVVHHLDIMAFAVCIGAPMFGLLSARLRRFGIKAEHLLVGTLSLSALAQIALILRLSLPPVLVWIMISLAGATTVLGFTLISSYFPKSLSARANGALNMLDVGGALLLQSATGFILAQWPSRDGAYPLAAHQTGLAIPLFLQFIALTWFLAPRRRPLSSKQRTVSTPPPRTYLQHHGSPSRSTSPCVFLSRGRNRLGNDHTGDWPFAALASTVLCIMLASAVVSARGFTQIGAASWISFRPKNDAYSKLLSVALPRIVNKVGPTAMSGVGR